MTNHPPRPADLQHLRSSNGAGLLAFAVVGSTTVAGLALATRSNVAAWAGGQVLLAIGLVQWFAVLHECGHDTLFRSRRWNRTIGSVAGFLALIPFASWTRVHGRHHRWTGWQDLDPTTAALAPRSRGRLERGIVNVCWRFSIPLFSIAYRIDNYWRLPRLFRMFPADKDRRRLTRDAFVLIAAYALLLWAVGPWSVVRLIGPALALSLVVEDVLLLSQHTHLPQHVSHGRSVQAFPAVEQEAFTRSLRLPWYASTLLLHFDAHELHHMYPFVPGYRLHRVDYAPQHEVGWWRWIRAAKGVPGEVFLFQNRNESGWEI